MTQRPPGGARADVSPLGSRGGRCSLGMRDAPCRAGPHPAHATGPVGRGGPHCPLPSPHPRQLYKNSSFPGQSPCAASASRIQMFSRCSSVAGGQDVPGLGWEMVRGLKDEEEKEEEAALPQPCCGPGSPSQPGTGGRGWQGVAGGHSSLPRISTPAHDCWHVHCQHLGLSIAGSCAGLCSQPALVGPPVPWRDPPVPGRTSPTPQGCGSPQQIPRAQPSAAPTQPSSTPYQK